MKTKIGRILPGESFRVIAIAACIGLMAGAANILFRATVDLVHDSLFVGGSAFLGLAQGGLH
ncbi:MAG TPA: Cl- channel voltage-gated family protein, partial [Desulfurivibrionaceae bacterium]